MGADQRRIAPNHQGFQLLAGIKKRGQTFGQAVPLLGEEDRLATDGRRMGHREVVAPLGGIPLIDGKFRLSIEHPLSD